MWGGTADRNMISNMKGLPTSWDVKNKKNVKWVAQLGSQTYGNVVVAGGVVFVGTNNEGLRDPKITGDKGILMAFRESDGTFLWQMVHDKLAAGPCKRLAVPGRCLFAILLKAIEFITFRIAPSWCVSTRRASATRRTMVQSLMKN